MNHGPATYFTYRDNQRAFEAIGAWESNEVSITGRGDPEQVEALSVSDATLPLLRVQPLLGRLFNAEDDAPGSPLRVVLTYGYWQRRFGGAEDVIGQSLAIDGAPGRDHRRAAGVVQVPARPIPPSLLPMQLDRARRVRSIEFDFQALARLKPGVTLAQANADMARMIPLLPADVRRSLKLQPNVRPLADDVIGDVGQHPLDSPGGRRRRAAHRLRERREPVSDPRRRHASRNSRCARRSARAAAASRACCCPRASCWRSPAARSAWRSPRPPSACCDGSRPRELPRVDEIGIDLTVLLFTLAISVLSGVLFGLFAVAEIRDTGHRGAQGRRPIGERRARRGTARATRWSWRRSRWP